MIELKQKCPHCDSPIIVRVTEQLPEGYDDPDHPVSTVAVHKVPKRTVVEIKK